MTTNQLPEIQVSPQIYTILKIVCLIAVFTVICINILSVNASIPPNTTDWNFGIVEHNGSSGYPDGYYNDEGYPIEGQSNPLAEMMELHDDNKEELEEEQDEEEHEEESDEYYDDN